MTQADPPKDKVNLWGVGEWVLHARWVNIIQRVIYQNSRSMPVNKKLQKSIKKLPGTVNVTLPTHLAQLLVKKLSSLLLLADKSKAHASKFELVPRDLLITIIRLTDIKTFFSLSVVSTRFLNFLLSPFQDYAIWGDLRAKLGLMPPPTGMSERDWLSLIVMFTWGSCDVSREF
ncbi:hypothetical protein PM082_003183 [Marasmius tenuissimus]|nr:hypothetical protein PM082_000958 [Marasmius tenuissimus]KAJ8084414.1 hypothetical protein PM082_003183 [Marasmius tenuissimus]